MLHICPACRTSCCSTPAPAISNHTINETAVMTLRIGLLWHAFGWPNLGVDALSRTNIAILRAAAERVGETAEFLLLGKPGNGGPTGPDIRQGPYLRIRNLIDGKLGDYTAALRSCDLIVDICAGDGF